MRKRQLPGAAALLLAAACAQAQETTWQVQFHDVVGRSFYWSPDPSPPEPAPITLSGLVKGEDRNRDGRIDLSELNELRFGHDIVSGNYANCGAWSDIRNGCTLEHFVFAPEGPSGPSFEMTGSWYEDSGGRNERIVRVDTGEFYRYDFYRSLYGSYVWTADTTLQVTQVSPVPEPAHGLMLAAGLAVVLGARRRPVAPGWMSGAVRAG